MTKIKAPFTLEQAIHLNAYQKAGSFHSFTCGNDHDGHRVLVATPDGWRCEDAPACDYTQDWAWEWMATS